MRTLAPPGRQGPLFLFTACIIALFSVILLYYSPGLPGNTIALGLASFVVLAVLMEAFPLSIPLAKAHLALSGTIFSALILLFSPTWAAIAATAALLISELIFHRRSLSKKLFNSIQSGFSVLIAAIVFNVINGGPGLDDTPAFFIGATVAFITYWLVNTWLVSFGAYILYGQSPYRFWQSNFRWALFYELTSAPIALAVAYAYQELWIIGLLLLTLPILMVRLAYSQYLQLKQTYRETVRTLVKIIEMHDP